MQAAAHVDGPPLGLAGSLWIGDVPRRGAQLDPERVALLFADSHERMTYADLDRASDAFAAALLARNIAPGERIAYLGRNSDLFFPVLFGSIRMGCVLVPLNPRLASPEIEYQLRDCGARLLVHDPELRSLAQSAVVPLESPPDLWPTETDGAEPALRSALKRAAPRKQDPHDPDQVVLQMYTSGTTGRPKGVLISHGALSAARHAELQAPQLAHLEHGCTMLSPMPNFHIGGTSWVLMGLVRMGSVILTADPSPANLLRLLREHGAQHTFMVPTVLRTIVEQLRATNETAPRLKGICYGAMPIDATLLSDSMAAFDCPLVQFFGMTENTGSVTLLGPQDHDPARLEKLSSVGKPYPGMSVEVRAPDRSVLGPGEHGEIWVKSPTMMRGYWRQPEVTARAIVDGWYATGDGGYLDAEGYLYLTDRIKDMIVSGGENVSPAEVEEVLRGHPAVADAAIVGCADPHWGERVIGYVELRPGAAVTAEELLAFARARIAGYKCPKTLHFISALPRTASGKVQRAVLRQQAQREQEG